MIIAVHYYDSYCSVITVSMIIFVVRENNYIILYYMILLYYIIWLKYISRGNKK